MSLAGKAPTLEQLQPKDSGELSLDEKKRLVELLQEQETRKKYNKLRWFDCYEWQRNLANSTSEYKQVLAMCANQIGKSTAGAYITACHLTGLYPEWYTGHRFDHPVYIWAAGVSNDTTRDIIQAELFGLAESEEMWGTGMVPKECIKDTTRRRGATGNTFDSVLVQHYDSNGDPDGLSRIGFKSYEMGEEKFYGRPVDYIWLDEQPPSNIYTQCITRTVSTDGFVVMTFTPEDGVTPVVHQFMHDRQPGQFLLQASWDDAPHLDEATKAQLLAQYPPHERELRSKGIPVFGSGLVFPISEDDISCTPFIIPDSFARIGAIDFGWDHPTAVVWTAVDLETDTIYVYDCVSQNKTTAATMAQTINTRDSWVPMAWPKDGLQSDKGSGISLADQYRTAGVNMLHDWARNPIAPGDTSKGNNTIEPGIMDMLQRMETGRFKVFSHLEPWFQEFRSYHRKDGKIIAMKDDLMSATRYAVISKRYAVHGSKNNQYSMKDLPIKNWSSV
jgi:phage terminase large subunit-like protein